MAVEHPTTKTCTKCKTEKPTSMFGSHSQQKDGLQSQCKACIALYHVANKNKIIAKVSAYYEANREKVAEYKRNYREENRDAIAIKQRAYYSANRDAISERSRAYRETNADKIREQKREHYYANRDKYCEYKRDWLKKNARIAMRDNANRRAKKREAGGQLSKNIAEKLFKMQRGKCACCGQPLGNDYHLDHIMPLALGGSNTDNNVQLLRARCNLQKRAKHPIDFMQQRGFLL